MRSSRSDPLAPSLATLGSESDWQCPPSLLQRNQLPLLPKLRGLMLVPRPDKCAVAALNCKAIQGGTRVNQDLMHDDGRPHGGETGDSE